MSGCLMSDGKLFQSRGTGTAQQMFRRQCMCENIQWTTINLCKNKTDQME